MWRPGNLTARWSTPVQRAFSLDTPGPWTPRIICASGHFHNRSAIADPFNCRRYGLFLSFALRRQMKGGIRESYACSPGSYTPLAAGTSPTGSSAVNTLPLPRMLRTDTVPPCASTM
jgi:hypothetical protein